MKSLMLLLVAIGFCTSVAAEAPDVIGDHWYVHESRHFRATTNLPPAEAEKLIAALEQFHTAASQWMALPKAMSAARCEILAFDSHEKMVKIFATERYSGFMRTSLRGTQLVFAPDATNDHLLENARHEYAHFLLRNSTANALPRWYEEGNASFLAGMIVDGQNATAGGATKYARRLPKEKITGMSLEAIIKTNSLGDLPVEALALFYRNTWRLVHLLQLGHLAGEIDRREALDGYLQAIASGAPEIPTFEQYFSGLESRFTRYLRKSKLPRQNFRLNQQPDTTITRSEKISASTIAWRLGNAAAELNPSVARLMFDWLFREASSDSDAYAGLALLAQQRKDYDAAALHALKALDADSTSQFATVLLADAMIERCRDATSCRSEWQAAVRLYERTLNAEPGRLDALFGLGLAQLKLSDLDHALVSLQEAHRIAPWLPRISLYLGEAYRLSGHRAAARQQLNRAVRWEEDGFWRKRAEEALSLLDSELHDVPIAPMP